MVGGRKHDFRAPVRNELRDRAGHHCSFLGCARTTTGAGSTRWSRASKTGIACHIYPSAPNGPRSNFTPPSELDLASVVNGIWMCASHAELIDKDQGVDYPPPLLAQWREDREARARQALTGIETDGAILTEVRLQHYSDRPDPAHSYLRFTPGMQLRLTRLCMWRSSDSDPLTVLARLVAHALVKPSEILNTTLSEGGSCTFSITFGAPARGSMRVDLEPGRARYNIGTSPEEAVLGHYVPVLVDDTSVAEAWPNRWDMDHRNIGDLLAPHRRALNKTPSSRNACCVRLRSTTRSR